MKLNAWNGLSLRIIGIFVTAMLVSFTPELLRGFFGDVPYMDDSIWGLGFIDEKYKWGWRHYLYFIMCVALFAVQSARLSKWIDSQKNNFKP